jgi:hypothetical protein
MRMLRRTLVTLTNYLDFCYYNLTTAKEIQSFKRDFF